MKTKTTTPTITWTNYRGEWMIRSTEKLDPRSIVRVTKRDGSWSEVRVGELERSFDDAHIYSLCNN